MNEDREREKKERDWPSFEFLVCSDEWETIYIYIPVV